jgi:hypothetical protein
MNVARGDKYGHPMGRLINIRLSKYPPSRKKKYGTISQISLERQRKIQYVHIKKEHASSVTVR